MKTTTKKLMMAAALVVAMSSLSGCLLTMGPVGLAICISAMESGWCDVGTAILDAQNPGRQDALNPVPLAQDIADRVGVTINDLADYNDALPQIASINNDLEGIINKAKNNQLSTVEADGLAQKYGFKSVDEVNQMLQAADGISQPAVERFAQALDVKPQTAKIYFTLRFGSLK